MGGTKLRDQILEASSDTDGERGRSDASKVIVGSGTSGTVYCNSWISMCGDGGGRTKLRRRNLDWHWIFKVRLEKKSQGCGGSRYPDLLQK